MDEQTRLDAWFVHPKLAFGLLPAAAVDDLIRRLPAATHPMYRSYLASAMERALGGVLGDLAPSSLAVAHLEGTVEPGKLVWVEQRVYYKGIRVALKDTALGSHGRGRFHGPLSTDRSIKIFGSFNVEHLTSSTSSEELSGSGRHFILGYVKSAEGDEVELRLILIADRWGRGVVKPGLGFVETEPHHVFPSQIDQFAGVDWSMPLRQADLAVLKGVKEERVKEWLADILDEPEVPKDWGGEQFDLWTDRITINGKRVRAAFALKGPAKFHQMKIADLGINGDQVSRLANTVADLLVVQHCHSISAPVLHMLHAFAVNPARPRRYMTIDGYDTIRIFRHFGYLP